MRSSINHLRVKGIYRITGPEECVYIGSAVDIRQRWCQHRWYLRRGNHDNSHLQHAWNKYGEQAFVIEVLEVVERSTDLIPTEQRYLDTLFQGDRSKIYNKAITAGSLLGIPASEERKRKIGIANSGRVFTEEHRKKLSEAHKGQKPTNLEQLRRIATGAVFSEERKRKISESKLGKPRSPETIKKMSEGLRGVKHSQESRDTRSLRQSGGKTYTLISPQGQVFASVVNINAFAAEHNLSKPSLLKVVKGVYKQHKGWTGYINGESNLMA